MKTSFGPWIWHAFRVLRHLRFLRGSALDPFGRSEERRQERQLIVEYRELVEGLVRDLNELDFEATLALARLPEQIRGFGHVKQASAARVQPRREQLLATLRGPASSAGRPGIVSSREPAVP